MNRIAVPCLPSSTWYWYAIMNSRDAGGIGSRAIFWLQAMGWWNYYKAAKIFIDRSVRVSRMANLSGANAAGEVGSGEKSS